MRRVAGGVVAALFAAGASVCAANELDAVPNDAALARTMFLAGGDIWHTGGFVHGGLLWSPGGLTQDGFTLKLLAGAGTYRYRSGALGGAEVTGFVSLGSVMPGWRFKADKFELTAYAGLDAQDHRLSAHDPGARLRGAYAGVRAGADLWYEPAPGLMVAGNVSVSTIGPNYWARMAAGWRLFETVWFGPEIQALGGHTYDQLRIGVHATSFKTGEFEWSAGLGFATDTDRRSGVYARIGVLTRR